MTTYRDIHTDLKKLLGIPPFNTPNNICWNDPYFRVYLERYYNKTIEQMRKETGI